MQLKNKSTKEKLNIENDCLSKIKEENVTLKENK